MAKNPRIIDLSGQKFGRWLVSHQDGNAPGGAAMWRCVCECGAERRVMAADLRAGKSVSCGCARTERIGQLNRTHGSSGTRLHQIWKGMRQRCLNPKHPGYIDYGGRGIMICPEWGDFKTFQCWAMASGYSVELSIERCDVNGNYSPENCVWATALTQSANRRFVSRADDGELWWHKAQANGITASAYRTRLHDGWSLQDASTRPMRRKRARSA
jgi:hypothetical protein